MTLAFGYLQCAFVCYLNGGGVSALGSTWCLFGQTTAAVVLGDEKKHNFFVFLLLSIARLQETTRGDITAQFHDEPCPLTYVYGR